MKSKWLIVTLIIISVTGLASFKTIERRIIKRNLFRAQPVGIVYLEVDKSDYELKVYDEEGWYATYPVVFGNKDLNDKYMEGDRRTPEGTFRILSKKPHQKWHKMLMLDYPTQESLDKFKARKAKGVIPAGAKIGGGIAIHGTWPHDDLVVDDFTNWTNGCVALKNEDLDELDAIVPIGTKVIIKR
jgi:murein L,D-transpeptidase YafK